MSQRIIGPFNRVEGDLEVRVDIDNAEVRDAWVVSPLYRGFEQILHGKDPRDTMVYTPRICGICSVSQSVAAAAALANAQQLEIPDNGRIATNLILANENVADHLTHFYLFFMPDFARDIYITESWHTETARRFRAVSGSALQEVLPARANFMHLMGLLAGKWPHSLAIQPGGTTRPVKIQEQMRISSILFSFRNFLESVLFGDTLEHIVAIESLDALRAWSGQHHWQDSDFLRFLQVADALKLEQLGQSENTYMSYGAYPGRKGNLLAAGIWQDGTLEKLQPEAIREDVSHSWMSRRDEPEHPFEGVTEPDADAPGGYSWCKAPRLGGRVVEVGALARQMVNGHPLVRDLNRESGANVRNRVIARLLEIAVIVMEMERWTGQLKPGQLFCTQEPLALNDETAGVGLVEAARGSLGHWLRIRNGRILNYQIIAPTTWNFSPRDTIGKRGALEQALIGAPVRDGEKDPVAVQHIVRSFDPCMVCTVH